MITFKDALLIARAKLKMRRIRLILALVVSSVMFAGLFFATTLMSGVVHSVTRFNNEGFGSRFFVSATPIYDSSNIDTPEVLKKLSNAYDQRVKDKKAAAQKLGVAYDESTDYSPTNCYADPCSDEYMVLNPTSPIAKELLIGELQKMPRVSDLLKQAIAGYDVLGTYRGSTAGLFYDQFGGSSGGQLVNNIVDGKEVSVAQNDQYSGPPKGFSTVSSLGWNSYDDPLLEPFLLPGQTLAVDADGSVPVVVPVSVAQEVLGLADLPDTATSKQRVDRIVDLRARVAGAKADLCYRNSASRTLFDRAQSQLTEADANKGKAGYVAPSLQYQQQSSPCLPVTISKDSRSSDEKQQASNEVLFAKQFGDYVEPEQGKITVKIVGLTQDQDYGSAFSLTSILGGLVQSSLGAGWFSPNSAITPGSVVSKVVQPIDTQIDYNRQYYIEFSSAAQAKKFAEEQGCKEQIDFGGPNYSPAGGTASRSKACLGQHRYFDVSSFGSSAVALETFIAGFWKVARYFALTIMVMASIVLMGVVGKIIADSRRETAVFRALGATRPMIAQIYLTFTLLLALIIAILSSIIGGIGALYVNSRLSDKASVEAIVVFNSSDTSRKFSFFGINPMYVAIIVGLIVLAALLSAALPLLTNVRRNPIKDMRDEG